MEQEQPLPLTDLENWLNDFPVGSSMVEKVGEVVEDASFAEGNTATLTVLDNYAYPKLSPGFFLTSEEREKIREIGYVTPMLTLTKGWFCEKEIRHFEMEEFGSRLQHPYPVGIISTNFPSLTTCRLTLNGLHTLEKMTRILSRHQNSCLYCQRGMGNDFLICESFRQKFTVNVLNNMIKVAFKSDFLHLSKCEPCCFFKKELIWHFFIFLQYHDMFSLLSQGNYKRMEQIQTKYLTTTQRPKHYFSFIHEIVYAIKNNWSHPLRLEMRKFTDAYVKNIIKGVVRRDAATRM